MQTRSFCHAIDLVDGLIRLMASADKRPVNLGNPEQITIRTSAQKIITQTASLSTTTHHPLPLDDPRQRCPDISRAAQVLRWAPTVPLDQGLAQTILWFKMQLAGT